MNFPEPCDVEAESVPEFDLRHDVSVTLTLGKPARTRQLVEEAEAHLILHDWGRRHPRLVSRMAWRARTSNRRQRGRNSQLSRESLVIAVGNGGRNSRGSTAC